MSCRAALLLSLVLVGLSLIGCGRSRGAPASHADAMSLARWSTRTHVRGIVDLSPPRSGRSIAVAARGRLELLAADGTLRPFAGAYSAPRGLEPYIASSDGERVNAARCTFARDSIYALRLTGGDGVTVIDTRGRMRKFASLPSRGLENGIAFDVTGHFGHRLLVTATASAKTTVYAIDCNGHVQVLTRDAPRVEGGLAVAPATFGRFAGALVAPDELSGKLWAIGPDGRSRVLAASGLPHGQDIGVESEGFVPTRFAAALVADRRTRRNRHPGDDAVLGLTHATLTAAGVQPGALLAVSEGGAATIAVTCGQLCRVRYVAAGPSAGHIEGHVVFARSSRAGT